MLNRIRRLFRALFGWMLRGAEDPELILEQLKDDLRNKIPQMNAQVAEVVKHEKMLQMQGDRQAQLIAALQPQVEAAVKAGPERKEAAKALIMQLQTAQAQLADTQGGLVKAKQNSQQMLQMRMAFEQKIRQQMEECTRQMSRAKQASAEEEMAQLMGSFQVGDEKDTLDRMTERVDERLARAEARTDVASQTVDNQIAQIQQQTALDSAEGAYLEYQRQLGLAPEAPAEEATKTMAPIPVQAAPAAPPAAPPGQTQQSSGEQDIKWAEPRQTSQDQ